MAEVVWENTVDGGTYHCWVERTDDYTGQLKCERVDAREMILDEAVTLSYRAIFGPDVADVSQWQDRVIEAIDAQFQADEGS